MNAPVENPNFLKANPHALASILEASETKSIIAARDIFDISGTKLWARNLPVSQSLQRKLLDRQLREPLETCLQAEDGVTSHSLWSSAETLVYRDDPLGRLLRPWAQRILPEVRHVPLHAVVQLLLTASEASRPQAFEHAVQAMLLAGVLNIAQGGNVQGTRLAMLCGLVHDLGEMYVAPAHGEADADRDLDVQSYQHLVVHPHVGQLLISQLTNYPAGVARAVAEHHERLDGSGYPHRLEHAQLSPLGRLMAVTEAALAALRQPGADLSRVSVSLRVVPGEFDLNWVGFITDAARTQPLLVARQSLDEIKARLARLDQALKVARQGADHLLATAESSSLKDAAHLSQYLLSRLRTGWNASGLWTTDSVTDEDAAEVEAIEAELLFRLQAIERASRLVAGDLPATESLHLAQWCKALRLDD